MSLVTDLEQALSRMRRNPDLHCDLKIPHMVAGLLVRRNLRAILASARLAGAQVDYEEQRGWLDSVFTIRMQSTGDQVAGPIASLLALLRSAGRDG